MADGILGLGSSGSLELNSELIEKLKTAESESVLDPITEDIEETETEIEAVSEITSKIAELLEAIESFDLYTSGTNVFNEVSATTSGSSVSFDAADTSNLNPGTINVSVEQLATKDVYQSNKISDVEEAMSSGTLSITIGEETYEYDTDGKTYEELVTEMSYNTQLDVSLEQVSDTEHRLIVKSANSGLENAITISQDGDLDLGFDESTSHVLSAQNFKGTIDGIEYNLSSNSITMDNGLMISALEEGDSSISIAQDSSYVIEQLSSVETIYNELVDLVDSYTIGDEDNPAIISDASVLRTVMNDIKNTFYSSYGLEDEESIFAYGISFDSDGYMEVDYTEFSEALTNNYDDIKELFVGYAEKEGIGTTLKTYLTELDSSDGLLTSYEERLDDYLEDLNDDYDEQSEKLDEKYEQMATQFAAYTVIITEMENAFASLKLIIDGDSD